MAQIAYSPFGYQIKGTLETVPGCALGTLTRGDDGKPVIEYDGGTEMWWDDQRTDEQDGELLYVDTGGNTVKESQIFWREEEEGDDDPLHLTQLPAFAVIIRAIHCSIARDQADALNELRNRGLWLNDEQMKQAGLA